MGAMVVLGGGAVSYERGTPVQCFSGVPRFTQEELGCKVIDIRVGPHALMTRLIHNQEVPFREITEYSVYLKALPTLKIWVDILRWA